MKGIYSAVALASACIGGTPFQAAAFAPASYGQTAKIRPAFPIKTVGPSDVVPSHASPVAVVVRASKNGEVGGGDGDIDAPGALFGGIEINNPAYALTAVLFLGYAYARTTGEAEGASMEILQQYLADPLNSGLNEIFITIWDMLGLFFIPMACLLMPGARGQKLPATPFLLGTMLGYAPLSPYIATRTPDPSTITKADLGWFTANILENKLFNYFIVLMFASAYATSGLIGAFSSDPGPAIQGFGDLFSETAIASASTVDFTILTVVAASFIPEDLSRRGYKGEIAPSAIAALTTLLPGVGVALYCALRPKLDDE